MKLMFELSVTSVVCDSISYGLFWPIVYIVEEGQVSKLTSYI